MKNNSGFVIMSASLSERPILAYSNKGTFELDGIDKLDGVFDWLALRYFRINSMIENGTLPTAEINNQWALIAPSLNLYFVDNDGNPIHYTPIAIVNEITTYEVYGPFLTTRWDQRLSNIPSYPHIRYNNFVRHKNCSDSLVTPAGCVAVAMGQIMKYYNHPNIYNINSMPNVVNNLNWNTNEAKNIARLMKDIGEKVNMNYSCNSSGASSQTARNAFVNNYSYNASNLSPINKSVLIQNLKTLKPVYLRGCREKKIVCTPKKVIGKWTIGKTKYAYTQCHAWVADGCEEINITREFEDGSTYTSTMTNYISMNWGWGGSDNGFYHYLTIDDSVWGNIAHIDFIYEQKMIANIIPN